MHERYRYLSTNHHMDIMTLSEFKEKTENLLGELEELIQQLPQKGNTCSECQRTCLQQAVNEVYYAVNGTEEEDLIEDDNED